MEILNYKEDSLNRLGGIYTGSEINHQPRIWKRVYEQFKKKKKELFAFVNEALQQVDQIILTGAGTSSFIGYSLSGLLFNTYSKITTSVATTDIVSFPSHYFDKEHRYLVISFARSGESPESKAALDLADMHSKQCFHLIITCNENSTLARFHSKNPVLDFSLPEETNDKSLAMTSSYSSMLLSGLLLGYQNRQETAKEQVNLNIKNAQAVLSTQSSKLKDIAALDFKRAVFLGSGPLFGTATEAALKLQELTGGKILCKSDTFLGFRHGPKAVIDEQTLVVYFFSKNDYVHQYEVDLVKAMDSGYEPLFQLGITPFKIPLRELKEQIVMATTAEDLLPDFQALSYIVPAQILAFYKSIHLGLKPDTPSVNGAISRIVKGVKIYPIGA